jgi:hypothetical protein
VSFYTRCSICNETTKHACDDARLTRTVSENVLRCQRSSKTDKLEAMESLGFDTDWIAASQGPTDNERGAR